METIKELLNIFFDLTKNTKNLEDAILKELTDNCAEDTYIMGINFYSKPLNNLIKNLDNYLDKFEDFQKYQYAGKNIEYIIYERDIFQENKKESHKEVAITYQDGRQYYINNKDEAIFYLIDEIIPTFIKNLLSEKDNKLSRKEIEENISKEIIKILLIFHKETTKYINEFNIFINKFANQNIDLKNNQAIKNLEENIDKKLLDLNKKTKD